MSTYKDSDGNECTLQQLCRREPEWACNQILRSNLRISDLKFALGTDAAGWFDKFKSAKEEAERLRSAISDIAEGDCAYGDGCPTFGSNHGKCLVCIARDAIK